MKKFKILSVLIAVIALLSSCSLKERKSTESANYQVIPLPSEIVTSEGNPFVLSSSVKILFPEGNEKMHRNAEFLAEFLDISTGIKPDITSAAPEKNAIILGIGLQHSNKEAYEIVVDENSITITGASEAAVFYGIQTLRKSVSADATNPGSLTAA